MFKFLTIVIVFAVPIICRISNERQYDRNVIKKRIERSSYEDCNESEGNIYVEGERSHKNCLNEVDHEKFEQEVKTTVDNIYSTYLSTYLLNSTLSDEQNSATINIIQKYCPNLKNIFMCHYNIPSSGCIAVEQIELGKTVTGMYQSGIDFWCENKAARANKFINEKYLDCIIYKHHEIKECMLPKTPIDPKLMTANEMCILMEDFLNCLIKAFEPCQMSQNLKTFMKSLFAYVRPAACVETGNMTTPSTPT